VILRRVSVIPAAAQARVLLGLHAGTENSAPRQSRLRRQGRRARRRTNWYWPQDSRIAEVLG